MKKTTLIMFLLFSVGIVFSQTANELRGVWLTNVDSYVLTSQRSVAEAMDYLAGAGINVVFPVVWNKGYTVYPSRIMDSLFQVPIISGMQNADPLKNVVIEAHRNGIEVIPWFEFGFSSSYSLNGGHILAKYPGWACKDQSGKLMVKNGFDWMNGINPDVQNFMLSLITEVIDNYDIDGIQGDDRLPAMPVEGGYDSLTTAMYSAENGGAVPPANYNDAAWKKWRAGKLNNFFKRLKDTVKAKNNSLILSSAPSVYPWGYDNYLQDSKTWVDSGIVENFIPQLYRTDSFSYTNELATSLYYVPAEKRNIFFAGVLAKSGSYVISNDLLMKSIQSNRQFKVNGEAFFFYEGLRANNNAAGDTLKMAYYSQPALLPYRNGNVWRPKALIVNEDEPAASRSGNWEQSGVMGYKPNIYWTNDSVNYASITYKFNVPADAWYSVYAYMVPNVIFTKTANYTVFSDNDSSAIVMNQQESRNTAWVKLKDAYLRKGERNVVKIDNKNITPGKYLLADAVMLQLNRKLSPDAVITSVENGGVEKAESPVSFQLGNNYPNPFNPSTRINYYIPETGRVTLKVYDILGRETCSLVDEVKMRGTYSIDFNASSFQGKSLSSGVYFYRLQSGGFSETKKMLLLK
jgi:uncharacterized lipoprotein YddW (UPF0748 family)